MIGWLLSRKWVADRIIAYAQTLPNDPLPGYMDRYLGFNSEAPKTRLRPHPWFPWAIRVHHILRADSERHPHDHPSNAWSIVIRDGYIEENACQFIDGTLFADVKKRWAGSVVRFKHGEYHRISHVAPAGVWTIFIMGKRFSSWGFLVDGVKIDYKDYLK